MAEFHSSMDKDSLVPLYHQLKALIMREIELGNWPVDEMIPPELQFTEHFGLSRTTVRQAIGDLVKDDVLYRKKGIGTFVSKPKIEVQCLNHIVSVFYQMQCDGLQPSIRLLEKAVIDPPEEILCELELPPGSKVIKLFRMFLAGGEPLVTVLSYMPYDLCSFVLGRDLEHNSLYHQLAEEELTHIVRIWRQFEARLATKEYRKLLEIDRQCPVQSIITKAFNKDGTIIEYNISHYRGDRSKFVMEMDEFKGSMAVGVQPRITR